MATAGQSQILTDKIRVMVVDDSAVIRGLFTKTLEADHDVEVVSSVSNGEMAINAMQRNPVDIIVLDIEMPVMDGITALPKLLALDENVKVIIASTLTKQNAKITLEALEKGASECLSKPSSTRELTSAEDFKRDLLSKVKSLGLAVQDQKRRTGQKPTSKAATATSSKEAPASRAAFAGQDQKQRDTRQAFSRPSAAANPASSQSSKDSTAGVVELSAKTRAEIDNIVAKIPARDDNYSLKKDTKIMKPKALAIGSSTGGPQALFRVIEHLKDVRQPIFLTQHMPETFTSILADHITRQTGVECAEAQDGEFVKGGRVYLAPGGYHMLVENKGPHIVTRLTKDEPENFCRPAVDPMIRSMMKVYGPSILATILTGMGSDGQKACSSLAAQGGMVLAQDKPSSVVWGMPGAVAMAGICFDVLPLDKIGARVREIAMM